MLELKARLAPRGIHFGMMVVSAFLLLNCDEILPTDLFNRNGESESYSGEGLHQVELARERLFTTGGSDREAVSVAEAVAAYEEKCLLGLEGGEFVLESADMVEDQSIWVSREYDLAYSFGHPAPGDLCVMVFGSNDSYEAIYEGFSIYVETGFQQVARLDSLDNGRAYYAAIGRY